MIDLATRPTGAEPGERSDGDKGDSEPKRRLERRLGRAGVAMAR
jgi:hypothetical protein